MKVVVIDSGVDKSHPIFKDIDIRGNGICKNINGEYQITEKYYDYHGHGTAICGILAKCKSISEIYVLKIYNEHLESDIESLIFALRYVEENISCNVINLSLGSKIYDSRLEEVCRELYRKGIIIVSAFDNYGAISFPAAFECVIGVDTDFECDRIDSYIYIENSLINILAKGGYHRLAWTSPMYIINQGSSFSCAYITAQVSKILEEGYERDEIWQELKRRAKKIYKVPKVVSDKNELKIRKAAVVPFSKEEKSLFNFQDILSFEIVGYYDVMHKISGKEMMVGLNGKEEIVKPYSQIKWEEIDTLIIGHLEEISIHIKRNIKRELLDLCIAYGKNVFSFDDELLKEYKPLFHKKGLILITPFKVKEELRLKAQKLYTISSPVLGIFGTSTKQGKYTLQLYLRKLFLEKGYQIGQLGTEPTAYLFGMEECFPFGYSSTVQTKGSETVELLNQSMYQIDKKSPDLILVGCQSGTIPNLYDHIKQLHIEQLEFLLGTNPDIIVLCVNIFDEKIYIERTISVIENLVDAKVVALGISPLIYPNNWEIMGGEKIVAPRKDIEKFKKEMESIFGIPAFGIGDKRDMELLTEYCIDILS